MMWPNDLDMLCSLSTVYANLGQHEEAVAMRRLVLVARQESLGPEQPDTLRSLSSLCEMLADLANANPRL